MLARNDELVTSMLTIGEVLVKPHASGNAELEQTYLRFFAGSVRIIPFDLTAARLYAEIRGRYRVRPADALQLACAASIGTDLFITNDMRLTRIGVEGIGFITGIDAI
jgi:predicted nucleic acid-binding protein